MREAYLVKREATEEREASESGNEIRFTLHASRLRRRDERGAVIVIVAVSLVTLLAVAAFVIDLGAAMVAKHELQALADAAALAGARQIGRLYEGLSMPNSQGVRIVNAGRPRIIAVAQEVARKNDAVGHFPGGSQVDILIGEWNAASRRVVTPRRAPDAVQVVARREISTFLAGVMGFNRLQISAKAAAALTPLGQVSPGALSLPVGIADSAVAGGATGNQRLTLWPTDPRGGCLAWTTFTATPATIPFLQSLLGRLAGGTSVSPEATAGRTRFQFVQGDPTSLYPDLKALYDAKKNPATGEWITPVAVYGATGCSPPGGSAMIVGFATAGVSEVTTPSGQSFQMVLYADAVQTGRGGGPDFGTKASVPGLVQ